MPRIFLKVLLLLILIPPALGAAQDTGNPYYGPYKFAPGDKKIIFSDTAIVRSTIKGTATDTLFAFDEVTVATADTAMTTIGRKTAPWYRITYRKGGTMKKGAIWGGTLAIHSLKHQGVVFACGVLSYPIPGVSLKEETGSADLSALVTFSIKAKKPGNTIQECRYNLSRESVYFEEVADSNGKIVDTHISPARGLPSDAKFIVHYGMSGEACGIPGYEIQAAWTGDELIRMPLLQGNADGGEWWTDETFVYPTEKGGKPGLLRVKVTEATAIEGTEKMKEQVRWRSYVWDNAARRFN